MSPNSGTRKRRLLFLADDAPGSEKLDEFQPFFLKDESQSEVKTEFHVHASRQDLVSTQRHDQSQGSHHLDDRYNKTNDNIIDLCDCD